MLPNVAYLLHKPLNLHRQYHQSRKQADKEKMECQIVDSKNFFIQDASRPRGYNQPGTYYVDWSDQASSAYIR